MRSTSAIWITYAVLALIAVPWYWRWLPGAETIVFGMPRWVVSSIIASALVSCYTGWLLSRRWPIEESVVEEGNGVDL